MKIVSLVPLSAAHREQIHALGSDIDLVDAAGWFNAEYARSWPEATVARYVGAADASTQAQRDAALADAEVVIAGFPYPLDLVARAPRLRWVHQLPAGASNLRRGDLWGSAVQVTTSRGHGETLAIAEYAIAGLLHVAKDFGQAYADRAAGHFDHPAYQVTGIAGHTLCVIGAGGIGREVARLGGALGMRVLGTRRRPAPDALFERLGGPADLHALLAESDFVAVCCQWTAETTGLLDAAAFAAMPAGAVLVNVARGEIIDEAALLDALDGGRLRGAVLDVFIGEFDGPPPTRLWQHPRVLITPHTSGATDRRRRRSAQLFCDNLRRFRAGETLECLVDWQQGY